MPTTSASNLDKEFERLGAHWSPRVVAMANGHHVKLAKVKGAFVWHCHAEEDEFFLVRKGRLIIRFSDRPEVALAEGDFHALPRGIEHMAAAPEQCWVVLVEPATTKHAGDTEHELTTSIEQQLAHLRGPAQDTRQQETEAQWPSKS